MVPSTPRHPSPSRPRRSRHPLGVALLVAAIAGVAPPATAALFTVTTAEDDGSDFTLRTLIEKANGTAGPDVITFDIPAQDLKPLLLKATLPTITEDLRIDGYGQPGASANTVDTGYTSDAVILIELDGSAIGAGGSGLPICAPNTVVQGLSLYGFEGVAIRPGIDQNSDSCPAGSADGSEILGNFIGMKPDGTEVGNSRGIQVYNTRVTIGGGAADRNVIGGHGDVAISFDGPGVSGSGVYGNAIGFAPNGDKRPNKSAGVGLGNDAEGVVIGQDKSPNRIGLGGNGVQVGESAMNATLYANDYGPNENLDIDLCEAGAPTCPDGANVNDVDDVDLGGNALQNSPKLGKIDVGLDSVTVAGTLDVPATASNDEYRIAFYWSEACAAAGVGPGEVFLASDIATLSDNAEDFELTVPATLPAYGVLTATATAAKGSTSEFSDCAELPKPPTVFTDGFE